MASGHFPFREIYTINDNYVVRESLRRDTKNTLSRWEAYLVQGPKEDNILVFIRDKEWGNVSRVLKVTSNEITIFPIFHTQRSEAEAIKNLESSKN
jgi:hypothetical protein